MRISRVSCWGWAFTGNLTLSILCEIGLQLFKILLFIFRPFLFKTFFPWSQIGVRLGFPDRGLIVLIIRWWLSMLNSFEDLHFKMMLWFQTEGHYFTWWSFIRVDLYCDTWGLTDDRIMPHQAVFASLSCQIVIQLHLCIFLLSVCIFAWGSNFDPFICILASIQIGQVPLNVQMQSLLVYLSWNYSSDTVTKKFTRFTSTFKWFGGSRMKTQ